MYLPTLNKPGSLYNSSSTYFTVANVYHNFHLSNNGHEPLLTVTYHVTLNSYMPIILNHYNTLQTDFYIDIFSVRSICDNPIFQEYSNCVSEFTELSQLTMKLSADIITLSSAKNDFDCTGELLPQLYTHF